MAGVLGALGVNAVPRVAVDNNSVRAAVNLEIAKDRRRVLGHATHITVLRNGAVGPTGVHAQ